jgi:hypothetical protein
MFNNLKIRLKVFTKKLFSKKEQKPQFINPYGMTDPTSSRPSGLTFKDGKIVLPNQKQSPLVQDAKKEAEPVKKKKERPDSSVVKSILEVIISDLEDVSGETERRRKRAEKERIDKDAYAQFIELSKVKK